MAIQPRRGGRRAILGGIGRAAGVLGGHEAEVLAGLVGPHPPLGGQHYFIARFFLRLLRNALIRRWVKHKLAKTLQAKQATDRRPLEYQEVHQRSDPLGKKSARSKMGRWLKMTTPRQHEPTQ